MSANYGHPEGLKGVTNLVTPGGIQEVNLMFSEKIGEVFNCSVTIIVPETEVS